MIKKSDILTTIKVGIILFLITGISALFLGAVNNVTAPIIQKNEETKQQLAMKNVQPQADSENGFTEITDLPEIPKTVTKVFKAQKDGEKIGYVVVVNPIGYAGEIAMVVGLDNDAVITGIDITSQSETPGLGANCTKDEFKAQFVGKGNEISVVKSNAGEMEIDAITSATITSKAVTAGVNAAIKAIEVIEGGK